MRVLCLHKENPSAMGNLGLSSQVRARRLLACMAPASCPSFCILSHYIRLSAGISRSGRGLRERCVLAKILFIYASQRLEQSKQPGLYEPVCRGWDSNMVVLTQTWLRMKKEFVFYNLPKASPE